MPQTYSSTNMTAQPTDAERTQAEPSHRRLVSASKTKTGVVTPIREQSKNDKDEEARVMYKICAAMFVSTIDYNARTRSRGPGKQTTIPIKLKQRVRHG